MWCKSLKTKLNPILDWVKILHNPLKTLESWKISRLKMGGKSLKTKLSLNLSWVKTLADWKINRLKMGRKSLKIKLNPILGWVKTLTNPNLGSLKPTSGQKLVWNFSVDRLVWLSYSVFIKGIERPFDKGVHLHFTPFPFKYLKCRKSEMQTWKLNLLSGLCLIV